jgi:predicted metalloprotease
MRYDENYTSSDVDDRRGEGGYSGGDGGGGGMFGLLRLASLFGWPGLLVGLVIAGVVAIGHQFTGRNESHEHRPPTSSKEETHLLHFVEFVFDDVQKSWRARIPEYRNARMEVFRGSIKSACGAATTAVGPFYCPMDHKVYIDLSFYEELRKKFGAPGDFAQAYVIAHEVGHHVQNQRGLLGRGSPDSIHVELQADCLAGAWARDADKRGLVEAGEVDQALNAAAQIGDDAIQRRTTGHVRPETFTHGTSAQRTAAFRQGLQGGPEACGVR